MKKINIAKQFSKVPAGRYLADGNKTGELFRTKFLIEALNGTKEEIEIVLDGAVGYPSSFLEEAFGGLVRNGFTADQLKERLRIVANEPRKKRYVAQIWDYITEAEGVPVA